ncbi:Endoglucanase [Fervidicola ferrireducens]|uniref:Endoglucanase n=2 Tax=Fervidicola ferrireducens TaxID=520764 RepID=A0A140L4R4_9FIRM|nr:Endoglucanase [Fervidicola ferrireducens]
MLAVWLQASQDVDKKFMRIKRIVIPILTFLMIVMSSPFASAEIANPTNILKAVPANVMVLEVADTNATGLDATAEQIYKAMKQSSSMSFANEMIGVAQVQYVSNFSDVKPTDWFYNDVLKARQLGLVAGVVNSLFAPNKTITFAEYITILVRVLGLEAKAPQQGAHWASGNIDAAIKAGIIKAGEIKNIDAGIPREFMAVYTCKALGIPLADGSQIIFADTKNVSPEIRGYINAAFNEYLTEGVGRDAQGNRLFGYGQTVTRAQLATMALRIKAYKENKEAYKNERALARQADDIAWQIGHRNNDSGSGSSGGTQQQQQYVVWNGYKFPADSKFYDMNKDGHPLSYVDFTALMWYNDKEDYDTLYGILTSKLDASTVKKVLDYAMSKKDVNQKLPDKKFTTPDGKYDIWVYSEACDSTVSIEVDRTGK